MSNPTNYRTDTTEVCANCVRRDRERFQMSTWCYEREGIVTMYATCDAFTPKDVPSGEPRSAS